MFAPFLLPALCLLCLLIGLGTGLVIARTRLNKFKADLERTSKFRTGLYRPKVNYGKEPIAVDIEVSEVAQTSSGMVKVVFEKVTVTNNIEYNNDETLLKKVRDHLSKYVKNTDVDWYAENVNRKDKIAEFLKS